MSNIETGLLIAKLRKEAGLTQKSLAKALYVTDKAVSKWERGVCMPDSSLLTKLSMVLDIDVEYLISGFDANINNLWAGEILVEDVDGFLAGKPVIFYLLSYFLLAGIKNIYFSTKNKNFINELHLERYGIQVSASPFYGRKTMILFDKYFLFGGNLTRFFQAFMNAEKDIVPVLDGKVLPFAFTSKPGACFETYIAKSEKKNLNRGMIGLPLNDDACQIINIYEQYSGLQIANLCEIAKKRRLI